MSLPSVSHVSLLGTPQHHHSVACTVDNPTWTFAAAPSFCAPSSNSAFTMPDQPSPKMPFWLCHSYLFKAHQRSLTAYRTESRLPSVTSSGPWTLVYLVLDLLTCILNTQLNLLSQAHLMPTLIYTHGSHDRKVSYLRRWENSILFKNSAQEFCSVTSSPSKSWSLLTTLRIPGASCVFMTLTPWRVTPGDSSGLRL